MAQTFGDRWEVDKPLGEGGQAHTFLVRDMKGQSETRYVLKRLKNIDRLDRFKREVEAVRNLKHENIVQLIDFDLDASHPYLVTEYCAGGSLEKAEPFWKDSPAIAFDLFHQICRGVIHAHSQEIIHRDLKPDNIFLREARGPAVVGDFGICYVKETGERITLTEEAVGARYFMAPELEDGRVEAVSNKSDTYSLGKILYWLMSGKRVFSREKHRDPNWDLKGLNRDTMTGWNNVYMEHVNRLLDLMIAAEPAQRRTVDNILILSRQAKRLIAKEFNPVAKDIKQPCLYCGYGFYVMHIEGSSQVRDFGITPVGRSDWRVLACNMCGHVQMFRIDLAEHKDWWA